MITRGIVYLILVLIFYFYCREEKTEVASTGEKIEATSEFLGSDIMADM